MSGESALTELGLRPARPRPKSTPKFLTRKHEETSRSGKVSPEESTHSELSYSATSTRRPFRSSPLAGPALSGECANHSSKERSPRIFAGLSSLLKEPLPCHPRPKSSKVSTSDACPERRERPVSSASVASSMPASLSLKSIGTDSQFMPSPPPSPLYDDFGAQRMRSLRQRVDSITRSGQGEFLTPPDAYYSTRRVNSRPDQLRNGERTTMDTRTKASRSSGRGQSSSLPLSASSLPSSKRKSIMKQPTVPTVRVTPALPINDTWYTHHAFAITPPFSRLGLRSPDVVLPLSPKEFRRKSAATQRGNASPSLRSTSATSISSSFSWNQSNADSLSTLASSRSMDPPAHSGSEADELERATVQTDDTYAISDYSLASSEWAKLSPAYDNRQPILKAQGSVAVLVRTCSSTDTLNGTRPSSPQHVEAASSPSKVSSHLLSHPVCTNLHDEAPASHQDPQQVIVGDMHADAHISRDPPAPLLKRKSMLSRVKSWHWGSTSSRASPSAAHRRSASTDQQGRSSIRRSELAEPSSLPAAVASTPHLPLDKRRTAKGLDSSAEACGVRQHDVRPETHRSLLQDEFDVCVLSDAKAGDVNATHSVAYLNVELVDSMAKYQSWSTTLKAKRRVSMKRAWKALRRSAGGAGETAGNSAGISLLAA